MKSYIVNLFLITLVFAGCKDKPKENGEDQAAVEGTEMEIKETDTALFFKLSLAQWSLHKAMESGEINPIDFSKEAKELGFEGIEYVNQLYSEYLNEHSMQQLLDTLKYESQKHQIRNVLIMVDGEGDLAVTDEKERNETVENHKKWVDAAEYLGCHSIRVNLFGTNDPEEWVEVAVDGLKKLSEYAATKNINVLVENHGWLSSNAKLLADVMKKVNMPNCGTLPDFGNFCVKRKDGERWDTECIEEYPKYEGVQEMMPYAKAVSAKSYNFDETGGETTINYQKMLEIVKKSGYSSYIGVEYEGSEQGEIEGIKATRDLLIKAGKQLSE